MFGPHKKDLTPLGRHGAVHKVAGKGHAPFIGGANPMGGYAKTQAAAQAPMAAHANPLPPAAPPMAAPAAPAMTAPPPAPMVNPAQDDGGMGPSGGI